MRNQLSRSNPKPGFGVAAGNSPHDKQIAAFRFRIGLALALRHFLRLCFAWLMVWATAALIARVVWQTDQFQLLWGAVGLPICAAVAAWLAMRCVPSPQAVRAALDGFNQLGGLLMAAGDIDVGGWNERLTETPMPSLNCQFRGPMMRLLAGVSFLAAVFLAPDRYVPAVEQMSLQIGGETQKLAEKLQILKEEEIISPEKAESLETDLNRIRSEALGRDPAKTMEAIDHLEHSFNKLAAEAAETAIKQTEAATATEQFAEGISRSAGELDSKQLGAAMNELAKMLQKNTAESNLLSQNLSSDLKTACECCKLSPQQLKQLAEALKKCKAWERAKLARLVRAKLIDASALEYCDKACECDQAALCEALKACKEYGLCAAQLAGKGGPGGGGPHAVMTWTDKADANGAKFKEKVLPPGAPDSLKNSAFVGISAADPTAEKSGGGSTGGALSNAGAGGGAAQSQNILPEHEKAVQSYFSRQRK